MKCLITIAVMWLCIGSAYAQNKTAVISGVLPGDDSVTVKVIAEKLTGFENFETRVYTAKTAGGRFFLKIDVPVNYSYVSVGFAKREHKNYKLTDFLVAYGDSVHIQSSGDSIFFTGAGAEKWNCLYELSKYNEISWKEDGRDISKMTDLEYFAVVKLKFDSLKTVRHKILNKWKPAITKKAYAIIHTDVYGGNTLRMYNTFSSRLDGLSDSMLKLNMQFLEKEMLHRKIKVPSNYNVRSHLLSKLLNTEARLTAELLAYRSGNRSNLLQHGIDFLKREYKGVLRSKLLTEYILLYARTSEGVSMIENEVLPHVADQRYKGILQEIVLSKMPGISVPDFELADSAGNIVSLSTFKNKTVVLTLWISGCSYCKGLEKEMKTIRNAYTSDSNLVFLNISADADIQKWKTSIQQGVFTDANGINLHTASKTDRLLRFFNIAGYPAQIIIDKKMRLVAFNPPRPVTPGNKMKFKEILESIK
jgi:hypothetical protein